MSKTPLSPPEFFTKFLENPKGSPIGVVKESHRFLSEILRNGDHSKKGFPTLDILVKLFSQFSDILPYVFKRLGKRNLLELALHILNEIVVGGNGRAKSLELQLIQTTNGGKDVVIRKPAPGAPEPPLQGTPSIERCTFEMRDKSGRSPAKKVATGIGSTLPLAPPADSLEYATPEKRPRVPNPHEFEVRAIIPS